MTFALDRRRRRATTGAERPIKTSSGRKGAQDEHELASLIALMRSRGVMRYLEIGARYGDCFVRVMGDLPAGAKGVAVDLPGDVWGKRDSEALLRRAVELTGCAGRQAEVVIGNSQSAEVAEEIKRLGPYDAIFIDADHRYDGVRADWYRYGHWAPLVAFHDIAPIGEAFRSKRLEVGVPRFWEELKRLRPADCTFEEFVTDRGERGGGGIGVVLWGE